VTLRAIPKIKFNKDIGSVTQFGLGIKLDLQPADFALPANAEQVKDFSTQEIYGHYGLAEGYNMVNAGVGIGF